MRLAELRTVTPRHGQCHATLVQGNMQHVANPVMTLHAYIRSSVEKILGRNNYMLKRLFESSEKTTCPQQGKRVVTGMQAACLPRAVAQSKEEVVAQNLQIHSYPTK